MDRSYFQVLSQKAAMLSQWSQGKCLSPDFEDAIAALPDPLISAAPAISQSFWAFANASSPDPLEKLLLARHFNACAFAWAAARDDGMALPSWRSFASAARACPCGLAAQAMARTHPGLHRQMAADWAKTSELLAGFSAAAPEEFWNARIHAKFIKPFCMRQIKALNDFFAEA